VGAFKKGSPKGWFKPKKGSPKIVGETFLIPSGFTREIKIPKNFPFQLFLTQGGSLGGNLKKKV